MTDQIDRILSDTELRQDMQAWRHDLHRHPELGFEESRTADRVADLMQQWGIEVHRGLGGTGVVGVIRGEQGFGRRIGIRAELDALPLEEANGFTHASIHPGVMHACGHDGHAAMLLGAARCLAADRRFSGTVHVIFQPAEELLASGARRMLADGLLDHFPCDAIYAVHNFPSLAPGTAGIRTGPITAAVDNFEILIRGRGGHGGMPHLCIDPVIPACECVLALQRIVSRSIDATDACVLSATMLQGGDAPNVVPDMVRIGGTVRTLREEVRDHAETELRRIAGAVALAHRCEAEVRYVRGHPATTNSPREASLAAAALERVLGHGQVDTQFGPVMGGEDFSYFLQQMPGAYAVLGQGGSAMIHNPSYDFNDAILPLGAAFFVAVVHAELSGTHAP
ncbi:amidohydrolase [Novosphingobium sp.]|uniref:amidohydrolase n=1 Tax=Novosphingobium sp. TaxID=1874826 RepID=UPI0026253288|nr:amidohydrolase [Novosphingobium sp.]